MSHRLDTRLRGSDLVRDQDVIRSVARHAETACFGFVFAWLVRTSLIIFNEESQFLVFRTTNGRNYVLLRYLEKWQLNIVLMILFM